MFNDLCGKRKAGAAQAERQVGKQERLVTRNNWQHNRVGNIESVSE